MLLLQVITLVIAFMGRVTLVLEEQIAFVILDDSIAKYISQRFFAFRDRPDIWLIDYLLYYIKVMIYRQIAMNVYNT